MRGLTRFASSFVHQNVVDTSERIRLRVVVDGSWAAVSTDRADADALLAVVESRGRRGPAAPAGRRVPRAGPAGPAGRRRQLGRRDRGRRPRTSGRRWCASSSTRPAAWRRPGTSSRCAPSRCTPTPPGSPPPAGSPAARRDGIARVPGADGVARQGAVRLGDLAGAGLGGTAAAKARAGADPVDLPPGDYEVVLEPACVADLLHFLLGYGFNGRPVAEGRSFLRLGRAAVRPGAADLGRAAGRAVDRRCRTTPRARRGGGSTWSWTGSAAAVAHDRRTAAAAGADSTGHAVEGGERSGAAARPRPRVAAPAPAGRRPSWPRGCGGGCWSATSGTPGSSTRARSWSPG